MSRVHDALRRAEQAGINMPPQSVSAESEGGAATAIATEPGPYTRTGTDLNIIENLLAKVQEVPFTPSVDSHLVDATKPHEAPAEEFRTLRTRLNHLQTLQPIS